MKKIIKHAVLCLIAVVIFHSCEKRDFTAGTPSPYIAIEDIRSLYKGADLQLSTEALMHAVSTYGIVISDHSTGNAPTDMVVIQQKKGGDKLHGIALKLGESAQHFNPGDSIKVNIAQKELKREGFLYIDGITAADITKLGTVQTPNQRTVSISNIFNNPNNYESTLIKIVGAEVAPKPEQSEAIAGLKYIVSGADTLGMHVLPEASFAHLPLPRNVNITGILLQHDDSRKTFTIWPRYAENIEDVSDPEIPGDLGNMPLIISGFMGDPSGGDSNYEYIQLLANADINFAEIPFSVVTSNNAGAVLHTAGWATGGSKTLKFNLTEGSVKKGEYFYVGGHQKRINGANSTSISEAKWIRAIPYSTSGGDAIGDKSTNILPNSGNAGGIALFVGTNITEKSTPIDVIFYGGYGTASIIAPDLSLGYRISNNDHYKTLNPETGELTPFFSMSETINYFRHEHHGGPTDTDIGYFFMLGGKIDVQQRQWLEPRKRTLILLDKTSPIDMIESGDGLTQQIN